MEKILDAMRLDKIHSISLDDLVFQFKTSVRDIFWLHMPKKEIRIKVWDGFSWYFADLRGGCK